VVLAIAVIGLFGSQSALAHSGTRIYAGPNGLYEYGLSIVNDLQGVVVFSPYWDLYLAWLK